MKFSEQKANLIKALVEARKVMSSSAKRTRKTRTLKATMLTLSHS